MAGRIPQSFIDDLLARVDIVDVIDGRVPLKKQGSNWTARCPFHDEKTPSFTVSPSKQFYYCFGCAASGTALGFVMEYERVDFVEAVEMLAGELGLEVPRTGGPQRDDGIERLHAALAAADRFYQKRLREAPEAIEYLRGRGISGATAKRFGLGYAPPGWRHLLDEGQAGTPEELLRAGLVNRNESDRTYDRFRGRVMFPIRDRRGRTIAFGGRVLDDGTPKYLNSPETPVFHKGRELYGLYEARRARHDPPRLVVVEGYMDVVVLAEHGIDYAVATLGTSVGGPHIERLFSVVHEVVFCFDGDEAGRQAAWRALGNTLPVLTDGREARFLFLPEGEDPDSVVRSEGRAAFEQRLTGARPLADFLIEHIREGIDTTTVGGRAQLAAEARPLLARMPAGVYHDLLIERLATEVGLNPERLRADLEAGDTAERTTRPAPARPRARNAAGAMRMNPMRAAIGLLLQHPWLHDRLPSDHPALAQAETGAGQPGAALLADLRARIAADPDTNTARLLEAYRDTSEHRHLAWLAAHEFAVDADADRAAALGREFEDALGRIADKAVRARRAELFAASRERALTAEEKHELQTLMRPE